MKQRLKIQIQDKVNQDERILTKEGKCKALVLMPKLSAFIILSFN